MLAGIIIFPPSAILRMSLLEPDTIDKLTVSSVGLAVPSWSLSNILPTNCFSEEVVIV